MEWDPAFFERSPMFEPLRPQAAALRAHADWPSREALQALISAQRIRTAAGVPLALVAPAAEPYERTLYERGEMQHRSRNWHDLLNALAWLAWPRAKAALNAAHYAALAGEAQARAARRGRRRDALTLFDESGAVVVSDDAGLLEDICGYRWKRVFWERRRQFAERARVFVFGHALLEKALQPYVGMTAHALLVQAPPSLELQAVDATMAERLDALDTPRGLAPLPVLGVPGWWPGNEVERFYDNERYFRPRRSQPRTPRDSAPR